MAIETLLSVPTDEVVVYGGLNVGRRVPVSALSSVTRDLALVTSVVGLVTSPAAVPEGGSGAGTPVLRVAMTRTTQSGPETKDRVLLGREVVGVLRMAGREITVARFTYTNPVDMWLIGSATAANALVALLNGLGIWSARATSKRKANADADKATSSAEIEATAADMERRRREAEIQKLEAEARHTSAQASREMIDAMIVLKAALDEADPNHGWTWEHILMLIQQPGVAHAMAGIGSLEPTATLEAPNAL